MSKQAWGRVPLALHTLDVQRIPQMILGSMRWIVFNPNVVKAFEPRFEADANNRAIFIKEACRV